MLKEKLTQLKEKAESAKTALVAGQKEKEAAKHKRVHGVPLPSTKPLKHAYRAADATLAECERIIKELPEVSDPGRGGTDEEVSAPACTGLHLIAPDCTRLHQIAPNCLGLHRITPDGTGWHLIASVGEEEVSAYPDGGVINYV